MHEKTTLWYYDIQNQDKSNITILKWYISQPYIHTHTFDVLTWCYLEGDVAVGSLHDGAVFVALLYVQQHTAVTTLVGLGQILQNHPEVVLWWSKFKPCRQAVVAMVMTAHDNMARARPSRTLLLSVGGVEPGMLQDIAVVQGDSFLGAHHLDRSTLGTDVVQVGR